MYYVLVVKEGALEEICGVTQDKAVATKWASEAIGGIAPKRIIKDYEEGKIDFSHKESRWEGPFKYV